MNPQCARCGKVVYPTEKVNCLDKYWHKGCFHCEVCKMALNMNNYKGYDKKPYCNAFKFMSQLDTLSPETKPGQVAGAVCCEGSRLEDPCSQPLFFQGHRLPCKLSGRLGLPSGESEGLRSNSGGNVNSSHSGDVQKRQEQCSKRTHQYGKAHRMYRHIFDATFG
ncbi:hypothetical protein PANDA_000965 [Ailuropoda melanoleuca]|uniref:LIM zinc-binding domain-containing protein n=1 Tax=Ailuropoda melanoleuca TaxID=9646 RepID=D2GW17_AILME|nr:hypothetical protein PANDA_000965 [Ailuropoda melanoleuca]